MYDLEPDYFDLMTAGRPDLANELPRLRSRETRDAANSEAAIAAKADPQTWWDARALYIAEIGVKEFPETIGEYLRKLASL